MFLHEKKALAKVGTLYMRVSTLTSTMIQQRELKKRAGDGESN